MSQNYESNLDKVSGAAKTTKLGEYDLIWLGTNLTVGVARDYDGKLGIFLLGQELNVTSAVIRNVIIFDSWHKQDGSEFTANKLTFPALPHFDAVVAFICTELLRLGADNSLPSAFAKAEPIIELAIEQVNATSAVALGLAGELVFLDALCRNSKPEQIEAILDSWDGWKPSLRDFSVGSTGVEIKTTTGNKSSHAVQGVHQVDLNDGHDGTPQETALFLVSIGLKFADASPTARSIPQLLDGIVELCETSEVPSNKIAEFLFRVTEYCGGNVETGYVHGEVPSEKAFLTPYSIKFFRCYDMSDEQIKVLGHDELTESAHVDSSSVRFRVDLPTTIDYKNPIAGANQVARVILDRISL